MATGRLGVADLSATTATTIYTVPTDNFAVVTVNVCNRNSTASNIRVAMAATDSPANTAVSYTHLTLPTILRV